MPTLNPPASWPSGARDVYTALQTYRIVGASACTAAIVEALTALAADVAGRPSGAVYQELAAAGSLFCALKPNTAAYANVVHLLLRGLDTVSAAPSELAATVAQRGDAFSTYSTASVDRIAAMGADLLAARSGVLVHDYSSTILAMLAEAGHQDKDLMVFVTAGQPVDQGPKVARAVASYGHRVTYLPDTAVGRVIAGVDVVLSGVETLFQNGDLANTVGTFPIALVARNAGVPFYGVTERIKIHPTAATVAVSELTAQVLHGWPPPEVELPPHTRTCSEVLDLTPARLVTDYITEVGLVTPGQVAAALEGLRSRLA